MQADHRASSCCLEATGLCICVYVIILYLQTSLSLLLLSPPPPPRCLLLIDLLWVDGLYSPQRGGAIVAGVMKDPLAATTAHTTECVAAHSVMIRLSSVIASRIIMHLSRENNKPDPLQIPGSGQTTTWPRG